MDVIAPPFMYVGSGLLRRLAAGPGDVVHCRLRPADPEDVPIADDVRQALADAGRLAAFREQRPADRRRLVQPIEDAVQLRTRERRIVALVRSLHPR